MEVINTGTLSSSSDLSSLTSSLDPILGLSNSLVSFGIAAAIVAIILAVARGVMFTNDEVQAQTAKRIVRVLIFVSIVSFVPAVGAQIFVALGGDPSLSSVIGRL